MRDAVPAPLDELASSASDGAPRPGCELDGRDHDLAPFLVGTADHADVADRRMLEQDGLDLGRIDVHPAADDQVRAAIGEEEIAIGVDVARRRRG